MVTILIVATLTIWEAIFIFLRDLDFLPFGLEGYSSV